MTIDKIIIWLVLGVVAGTLAGRLVTFSRKGFGFWTNIGLGMLGALVGGFLFWLFRIDLGLGEIKVTGEDLVAAFTGSLVCLAAWWVIRKFLAQKNPAAGDGSGGNTGN